MFGEQNDTCPNCKQVVNRKDVVDERFVRSDRHTPPQVVLAARNDQPPVPQTPPQRAQEPLNFNQPAEGARAQNPPGAALPLFYVGPGGRSTRKKDVLDLLTLEGWINRRLLTTA